MKNKFGLLLAGALLLPGFHEAQARQRAQGTQVVVLLQNKNEVKGELLFVRENALVLATEKLKRRPEPGVKPEGLVVIKNEDIQTVTLKGKSRVFKFARTGFMIGGVAGIIAGERNSDESRLAAMGDRLLFGAGGAAVGAIVGLLASPKDKTLIEDFTALKYLARFKECEPQFLTAVD